MANTGDLITAVQTTWDIQNVFGTTTSGAYTATLTGGTTCGAIFAAPANGRVFIINCCDVTNSGASYSSCAIELRAGGVLGAGAVVLSPGFDNNILNISGQVRCSVVEPVVSLTPGATYNVRQMFLVGGGTGTFSNKKLIVQGQV